MWVTNTTTWYEFELTPEEYESYVEDPDTFMENNDVFGEATIVREKVNRQTCRWIIIHHIQTKPISIQGIRSY